MAEKNQNTAGLSPANGGHGDTLAAKGAQGIAALQQQPRTQQARPCPKDCRLCSMAQQICCSSMMSFQMFEVMNSVIQRLDIQSQRLEEIESRLSAIQSSEVELAAPCITQGDLFPDEG